MIAVLEAGSRYHAYRNPGAQPSLRYRILATYEFLEPMPLCPLKPGQKLPVVDHRAIWYYRSCRISSTNRWRESKTRTMSGMWPGKAWVAQPWQGS